MSDPRPAEAQTAVASRRLSPRETAETIAVVLIIAGVVMMMQPFWLTLFTYSFVVTLAGTVLFVIGSKFPA